MWLYTWDHNNHLTKVERKASAGGAVNLRVEYEYDVFSNRTKRTVDADGDGAGGSTSTKYAFDPEGNTYLDLDASGNVTSRRFYEDTLDAVFARVAESTGSEEWLALDRLNSVRDTFDASGTAINNVDLGSFGNVVNESSPANGDRQKFAGFEVDPDTQLGLNGERWYSFDIGGWLSNDPIGFSGGLMSLGNYLGNNPVNATDPTGLQQSPESMRIQMEREAVREALAALWAEQARARAGSSTSGATATLPATTVPHDITNGMSAQRRAEALQPPPPTVEPTPALGLQPHERGYGQPLPPAPEAPQIRGLSPSDLERIREIEWNMHQMRLTAIVVDNVGFLPNLAGFAPGGPWAGIAPPGPALRREPHRIYSARELIRRAEEPGPMHNFPESFNPIIFNGTRRVVSPDYILYTHRGAVNGREGTFEIGVRPSASGNVEVITHRFFRPDPPARPRRGD